ncbi:MAG: peptidoglycan editing factor PgeF [Clostridia bacterium]|nr:peptidoglycan editing factor PgeF [Clostridia bacterium]
MTSDKIPAAHMFTTRIGGVSRGVWESWNLGDNRGDDIEAVRENYRLAGEIIGVGADDFVVTNQVHGVCVRTAGEGDRHIVGEARRYEADGLVTNIQNLPLMIYIADCVPVLLHDPVHGVIGAVHCGWRSSVDDILGAAVEKMSALGARAGDMRAAIGASIGKCCFETDSEVPEAVKDYLGGDTEGLLLPGKPGKTMVDLGGANFRRLVQLGLRPENIDVSDECTMCRQDKYWSHRGTNGVRGTQAAVIILREKEHD